MHKHDLAMDYHNQGYNCAQAVAMPFCEEMGLDTATVKRATEGFGAGMGLPNMKRYTDYMDIQSTVGVGTTVIMRVNLPQDEE